MEKLGRLEPAPDVSIERRERLTVDGDGDTLGQNAAIRALESRYPAQLVELAVVIADAFRRLSVHDVELEVVGFGDGEEYRRSRVTLRRFD